MHPKKTVQQSLTICKENSCLPGLEAQSWKARTKVSYEIEPGLAAVGAIGEKALSAEDAGAARSARKAFHQKAVTGRG